MQNVLRHNIEASIQTLRTLAALEAEVSRAAQLILDALLAGRKVLTCGNGGSATDAAHLATELVCRYREDRDAYPALCLSGAAGDLTAIGNDYGFDEVFARQVRAFGQPGDVLVALSTSGRSENVTRALRAATERGVATVSLLGRDGGDCRGLATVELLVPGELTARIQEGHKLLIHTLCEMIDQVLVKRPSRA